MKNQSSIAKTVILYKLLITKDSSDT